MLPVKVPLSFAGVSNISVLTGTYTPNDDYRYLIQSPIAAPNFIAVLCDGQLTLTSTFMKSLACYAVMRFGFFSWVMDPANLLTGLFIDGRTGPNPGNTPMPQGVPVNYTLISGQATIS
jgi:hypothetical protein